jgi:Protein of unknown function, DUF547
MREGSTVTRRGGAALALVLAFTSVAAPAPRSPATGAATTDERSWRDWDDLVRRHVRGDRVDYAGFDRDREILSRVLELLAGPPPLARNDEIAFWINAYNAATVDLIVRERKARGGRLRSIKDIPSPWTRPRWRIGGAERTLDEIEHEILRRRFREPRIHFALVCASRSCPALRSSAYRGAFLDAQLDSAAREFLLDPTRNRFEPENGRIRISKIFDWYGKDFRGVYHEEALVRLYGPETGAALACAARFLPSATAAKVRSSKHRIEFLPYDWSLNSGGNAG